MSKRKTTDGMIIKLSHTNQDLKFIDSMEKGLYYATAPDDDRVAILCGGGCAVFTIEQLRAVADEAIDVWKCMTNGEYKRSAI